MKSLRATVFFLWFLPCMAIAGYGGSMRFSTFWPCSGNASFCAVRIYAEGIITSDTVKEFERFLENEKKQGTSLPPQPAVCFNSPGGDVRTALELGRKIRRLGFETCLAPQLSRITTVFQSDADIFAKNVICASACTFAILGGVNRLFEEGARLGVHQFYGANGSIGDSNTQKAMVILAAYVEEMGVSRALLDTASLVPASGMHWLSTQELLQFRIDNMKATKAAWKLEALNDGTIMALITQIKPGNQAKISLAMTKLNGKPTLGIFFLPSYSSKEEFIDALEALKGRDVIISVDARPITSLVGTWKRLENGALFTQIVLSENAIKALARGDVLSLETGVGRASSHYDASLDFPVEDLRRLLPAILK